MSWRLAGIVFAALVLGTAVARMAQDPVTGTATWDAARASGFAGYLLLWLSTLSGLALYLRVRPAGGPLTWMLEVHRISSVLALSFVGVHVVGLVLDPVVSFSPLDAVVPFTSSYRPVQVGLGVVSQWMLIVVLASTAFAGSMSRVRWRQLHYLSFPCWALALLHGILSGSDTGASLAMGIYVLTGASTAALIAIRLFGRPVAPPAPAPGEVSSVRTR